MESINRRFRFFREKVCGVFFGIFKIIAALIILFGLTSSAGEEAKKTICFTSLGGEYPPYSDVLLVEYDIYYDAIVSLHAIKKEDYAKIYTDHDLGPYGMSLIKYRNLIKVDKGNEIIEINSGASEDCPVCWLCKDTILYWDEGYSDDLYYDKPEYFTLMTYDISNARSACYRNESNQTIRIKSEYVPIYDMIVLEEMNSLVLFVAETEEWSFYDWNYRIMIVSLIDGSITTLDPWEDAKNPRNYTKIKYVIRHPMGLEHNNFRMIFIG